MLPGIPGDPLSLLGSAPSFKGGDAGPAFSDSDLFVTATQNSPFVFGGESAELGQSGITGTVVTLSIIGAVAWVAVTIIRRV